MQLTVVWQERKRNHALAYTEEFITDYAEKNTDGRGFILTGSRVMRLAMATAGEEVAGVLRSEAMGERGSVVGGRLLAS